MVWYGDGGEINEREDWGVSPVFLFTETLATQKIDATVDLLRAVLLRQAVSQGYLIIQQCRLQLFRIASFSLDKDQIRCLSFQRVYCYCKGHLLLYHWGVCVTFYSFAPDQGQVVGN